MSQQISFNRLPLADDLRLRDLVVECAHNLEPDLRVVGGLLPIGGARTLDLVAVDADSRLVLLEVRCEESAAWLLTGVDHYDWARRHADEVVRLYPQHRIDPARQARLIFISASFSEEFRRRVAYLRPFPAELAEYRFLEVNGVRGLYFEPVPPLADAQPRRPISLQAHLDELLSRERAGVAEALLARLAALDPGVRLLTHRGGVLALWEERLLARLEFDRGGLWVSDEDLDAGDEVRRSSDLEPVLARLTARVTRWRRLARAPGLRPASRTSVGAPALPSRAAGSKDGE